MAVDLQQIDVIACPFKWHGTKLCYLSRGRLRMIAKDVDVSPDGAKIDLYDRIVTCLEQSGAEAEIGKVIR